jgi:hypothetical protein
MEVITGTIYIAIAFLFFGLGYLTKDSMFTFVSSTLFLFVGLGLFAGGFEIVQGSTETYNLIESNNITSGSIDVAPKIEGVDGVFSRAVGLVLIWVSLYMLFVSWTMYKNKEEGGGIDSINL